jgi:serine/threonine protein kinase
MSLSSRLVRRSSRATNPRVEEDPDENLPITSGNNTYQIGNEIGKGGFAIVYKALNVTLGINVALKRFPLRKIDKESLQNIEVCFLQNYSWLNRYKYFYCSCFCSLKLS